MLHMCYIPVTYVADFPRAMDTLGITADANRKPITCMVIGFLRICCH
nr:MAG TPA: hypothetical protein [Bacteriophage sp.]